MESRVIAGKISCSPPAHCGLHPRYVHAWSGAWQDALAALQRPWQLQSQSQSQSQGRCSNYVLLTAEGVTVSS